MQQIIKKARPPCFITDRGSKYKVWQLSVNPKQAAANPVTFDHADLSTVIPASELSRIQIKLSRSCVECVITMNDATNLEKRVLVDLSMSYANSIRSNIILQVLLVARATPECLSDYLSHDHCSRCPHGFHFHCSVMFCVSHPSILQPEHNIFSSI